ncbi:hypothetical protein PM082_018818 [Marasmius tenuissimus]|nr:hypothetical protein PM082_018818 [Marasmius tenuissimus]
MKTSDAFLFKPLLSFYSLAVLQAFRDMRQQFMLSMERAKVSGASEEVGVAFLNLNVDKWEPAYTTRKDEIGKRDRARN